VYAGFFGSPRPTVHRGYFAAGLPFFSLCFFLFDSSATLPGAMRSVRPLEVSCPGSPDFIVWFSSFPPFPPPTVPTPQVHTPLIFFGFWQLFFFPAPCLLFFFFPFPLCSSCGFFSMSQLRPLLAMEGCFRLKIPLLHLCGFLAISRVLSPAWLSPLLAHHHFAFAFALAFFSFPWHHPSMVFFSLFPRFFIPPFFLICPSLVSLPVGLARTLLYCTSATPSFFFTPPSCPTFFPYGGCFALYLPFLFLTKSFFWDSLSCLWAFPPPPSKFCTAVFWLHRSFSFGVAGTSLLVACLTFLHPLTRGLPLFHVLTTHSLPRSPFIFFFFWPNRLSFYPSGFFVVFPSLLPGGPNHMLTLICHPRTFFQSPTRMTSPSSAARARAFFFFSFFGPFFADATPRACFLRALRKPHCSQVRPDAVARPMGRMLL